MMNTKFLYLISDSSGTGIMVSSLRSDETIMGRAAPTVLKIILDGKNN